MALIALDPCDLGLAQSGKDNVVLKISNVEGLPGIDFVVPWNRESAEQIYERLGEIVKNFPPIVETATLGDVQKEAVRHGFDPAAG